ncbi:hypothetical protein BRC92_13440 [Halobacteriales archaeon QS_4_69_31]|nr:MAG: hypothetical protein BRC92_13440 [Halobacteriales archaeon QS_4_69_31]
MPTRRSLLWALSTVGVAGCSLAPTDDTSAATPRASATPPPGTEHWYTHPHPTGNRTLSGAGTLRDVDPVTFEPAGQPQWLVAHPAETGSQWTVVAGDGRANRWHVRDGEATRVGTDDSLPADTQPVVATGEGEPTLLRPPGEMAAHASPMVAPGGDGEPAKLLYVAEDGALVVAGDRRTRFEVDALPDGRLAALGDGRYALFTAVTDRYEHGALGDSTEGTTLTVVDPAEPALDWQTTVGPPEVFEGLQPLVADLDGDGDPEVVTTVADAQQGARIAVFGAEGDRIATGPVHSPGWRHQLTVGPFGPDGRPELAVVRKPHVDHTLEFYRLRDGGLDVVATVGGFSTHTYGSRVLDGAVAGDFDDDGTVEALVPTTDRDALAAVRRSGGGASVRWRLPLDGLVVSNVAGISLEGTLTVGVGTGATVSVWQG